LLIASAWNLRAAEAVRVTFRVNQRWSYIGVAPQRGPYL
jgi:hypothetical protein